MTTPKALLKLGEELLAEPLAHANNATVLLAAAGQSDASENKRKAAMRALNLFFADSLRRGELEKKTLADSSTSVAAALKVHRDWLSRQHDLYKRQLLRQLSSLNSPSMQVAALSAVLELSMGPKEKPFLPSLFVTAVELVLGSQETSLELLTALTDHYLDFVDVRYHVFKAIHGMASRAVASKPEVLERNKIGLSKAALEFLPPEKQLSLEGLTRVIHAVLSKAKPLCGASAEGGSRPPDQSSVEQEEEGQLAKSWCGALESGSVRPVHSKEGSKQMRKRRKLDSGNEAGLEGEDRAGAKWATPAFQRDVFSDAWLSFLCLPLPEELHRKVLVRLHEEVIPHLTNPHLLADLLAGALESGGLLGMLALHAIFVLVTKHGLEYPAFFARLYQLLQPSVFYAKQRSRFFQLADVFLSSALVPAYTVAAFTKRFARLAVLAPPAGAMVCLAFVHNLLRRHPACIALIDRQTAEDGEAAETSGRDPYREDATDPAESQAVDSSLWEVKSLCNHYYPQVWSTSLLKLGYAKQVAATAKQILDKDLSDRKKTAEMDIGPLVGGSYTSLAKHELARRIRQVPTAFYAHPPEKLFDENCAADFACWQF